MQELAFDKLSNVDFMRWHVSVYFSNLMRWYLYIQRHGVLKC